MSSRFRKEDKFTGKLSESITESIASYQEAAADYSPYVHQKLQFFHLLFDGEAIRFYRSDVSQKVKTFEEACEKIKRNTTAKQGRTGSGKCYKVSASLRS